MFYKDNWLTWYYDGVERGKKTRPNSKYELKIKATINKPVKSYKEELLANARLIRDSFSEPFDLLFSGGLDSEGILRCNHHLGIPTNVYIFKYENNFNSFDVNHALRICNELNVKPKVIDFNLKHFFENDAYDIWKIGYFKSPGRLPHLKMLEYLDNIPIFGDGVPDWVYDKQWLYKIDETNHSTTCYANTIGRTVLADWYEYSPEVILSHLQTSSMQQLINNGPVDFNHLKYCMHKHIWPEIWIRPKLIGYESFNTDGNLIQVPDFMEDFLRQYIDPIKPTYTTYRYTAEELINAVCREPFVR
jgi:hypothetical protein